MSKLLLFAAPSGAGKTTIVRHLLSRFDELEFSTSATTRPRRLHEQEGKDYYFISRSRFETLIRQDAFVEWEEVYDGLFYGTLKSEVQRIWGQRKHIIFDIDVKGAMNIKKAYPQEALAVFVKPPSMKTLENRLRARRTESEATIQKRLARATEEMAYENKFDVVLVNDILEDALAEAEKIVESFIKAS